MFLHVLFCYLFFLNSIISSRSFYLGHMNTVLLNFCKMFCNRTGRYSSCFQVALTFSSLSLLHPNCASIIMPGSPQPGPWGCGGKPLHPGLLCTPFLCSALKRTGPALPLKLRRCRRRPPFRRCSLHTLGILAVWGHSGDSSEPISSPPGLRKRLHTMTMGFPETTCHDPDPDAYIPELILSH